MARGIDGAAHEGALTGGATVQVLAGGTDVIYPPEHRDLCARASETGAVISEFAPRHRNPRSSRCSRACNRIISGASQGVVVGKPPRGRAHSTARYAADRGRDVFAAPGSRLDPRAHGPNGLVGTALPSTICG